jgi:glycerol uptake operon antiterminator
MRKPLTRRTSCPLTLQELIAERPLIPAVRTAEHLADALESAARLVYLLCGDASNIRALIAAIHEAAKVAIVNVDLVGGLSRSAPAVEFLAECGADGIISTHSEVLKAAHSRKLLAIQRSFMLDSLALNSMLRSLEHFLPDAVEVLPAAAAPGVIGALRERHPVLTVTAGGLVSSLREIDRLVSAGVSAVSVSQRSLWRFHDA